MMKSTFEKRSVFEFNCDCCGSLFEAQDENDKNCNEVLMDSIPVDLYSSLIFINGSAQEDESIFPKKRENEPKYRYRDDITGEMFACECDLFLCNECYEKHFVGNKQ